MDRRIERTRAALIAALIELVRESGWRGASVSSITARANVGRTTFYEHFDDREHLLRATIDHMLMSFRADDGTDLDMDLDGLAAHLLAAGSELGNFFEIPRFRHAIADAVVARVAETTNETAARFAAGGMLAVAEQVQPGSKGATRAEVAELIGVALAAGAKRRPDPPQGRTPRR